MLDRIREWITRSIIGADLPRTTAEKRIDADSIQEKVEAARKKHFDKSQEENRRDIALIYGICPDCGGSAKPAFSIGRSKMRCTQCGIVHYMWEHNND